MEQQLLLFGKIYRRPNTDISRQLVFDASSDAIRIASATRARGRPRLSWSQEVWKQAVSLNKGSSVIGPIMASEAIWKKAVRDFCKAKP